MKKIVVFLFLIPISSFAQKIEGTVLDIKNNMHIENVNVTINQLNASTSTNQKGEFILSVAKELQETDSISFSYIGYNSKTIVISEFEKNNSLVFLQESIVPLSSINIYPNKPLKSKITFTKLKPSKCPVFSFGSILKDNKIYVVGGDSSYFTDAWKKVNYEKIDPTLEEYFRELSFQFSGQRYIGKLLIYDLKTNLWETSNIKFRKRAYHNLNEYNNKIYVLGGKRVSPNGVFEYLDNKIEVFDIKNQTIAIDNTNPHQASDFASFTFNNNIIVIGGSVKMSEDGKKIYSNKVHSYDIISGYWYELANMPEAKETSGVLIDHKIYLVGGFNKKPVSTIESFNVLTEKWCTEGELFDGISTPAIAENGDMIYFFENGKIFTYNTNSKQLKEFLISLPLQAAKLYFSENKLYLLGGYAENYHSKLPSADLFAIDINEFENTKPNRIKFL